jgi:hypothetical protein
MVWAICGPFLVHFSRLLLLTWFSNLSYKQLSAVTLAAVTLAVQCCEFAQLAVIAFGFRHNVFIAHILILLCVSTVEADGFPELC